MNPLALILFVLGVALIVVGFFQLKKRNLLIGLISLVVGLIVIGLPLVISSFLALFNP